MMTMDTGTQQITSGWGRFIARLLIVILICQPALAAGGAQVVDGSTPTQVDSAANGVPVIQIARPSASGLSHNRFSKFNVEQQGVILNNATAVSQTQLGGLIQGNGNLNGNSALLILNEVTGTGRSQLGGFTEIAGQQAEYILANPNGISCNGCGFINTPQVTLTTGTPQVNNGQLSSLSVNNGDVIIEGLGLDASNVDRLDIITRSLSLNAELHAQDLNIITGRNDVDLSTGAVTAKADDGSNRPAFALDASALGGMYANQIHLVGTESGVGVRSAADMAASIADLTLTADGSIALAGSSAGNDLSVTSRSSGVTFNDNAHAKGDVSISAAEKVEIVKAATVGAQGDVSVTGKQFELEGVLAAGVNDQGQLLAGTGDLNIATTENITLGTEALIHAGSGVTLSADSDHDGNGDLNNNGTIQSDNTITANAENITNSGSLHSGKNLDLTAEKSLIQTASGKTTANQKATITAESITNSGSMSGATGISLIATNGDQTHNTGALVQGGSGTATLTAHNNLTLNDTFADGAITATAQQGKLTLTGSQYSGTNLTLTAAGELNIQANAQGAAAGNVTASAKNIVLKDGAQLVAGLDFDEDGNSQLTANTGQLTVTADDGIKLATNGLAHGGAGVTLTADKDSDAKGNLDNSGTIQSDGVITANAENITNNGTITSGTDLKLIVENTLRQLGHTYSAGTTNVQAKSVINNGDLFAANSLTIDTSGALDNQSSGTISTDKQLKVDSASLKNAGELSAFETVLLTISGLFNQTGSGKTIANQTADITAASITNSGSLSGGSGISLKASKGDQTHNAGAVVQGGSGSATLTASKSLTLRDTFADGAITATAQQGDLTIAGSQYSGSKLTLTAAGELNMQASAQAAAAGNVTANAKTIELKDGAQLMAGLGFDGEGNSQLIANTGQLTVTADDGIKLAAKSLAHGGASVTLTADKDDDVEGDLDNNGTIQSDGAITANAKNITNIGSVNGAGAVTLNAANNLTNQSSARIDSGAVLKLTAGNSLNNHGIVRGNSSAIITANSLNNSNTGDIQLLGNITLNGGGLDNQGKILTDGNIVATLTSALTQSGTLEAKGSVKATATALTNSGTIEAETDVVLTLSQKLDNQSGGTIKASDDLTVDGALTQLTNFGSITSDGTADLTVQGSVTNQTGAEFVAKKKLTLTADSLDNSGIVDGKAGLTINLGGGALTNNISGVLQSLTGQLSLAADQITNKGDIVSGGSLLTRSNLLTNDYGLLLSLGDMTLEGITAGSRATRILNQSGSIETLGGDMTLRAETLDNLGDGETASIRYTLKHLLKREHPPEVKRYDAYLHHPTVYNQLSDGGQTSMYVFVPHPDEIERILALTGTTYADWQPTTWESYAEAGDNFDPANWTIYVPDESRPAPVGASINTLVDIDELVKTNNEARIATDNSGKITFDIGDLTNKYSVISAAGDLQIDGTSLTNTGTTLNRSYSLTASYVPGDELHRMGWAKDIGFNKSSGPFLYSTEQIGSLDSILAAGGTLSGTLSGQVSNLTSPATAVEDLSFANTSDTVVTVSDTDDGSTDRQTADLTQDELLTTDLVTGDSTQDVDATLTNNASGTLPVSSLPNLRLFQPAPPASNYVLETRFEFIDLGSFYGSDYFLDRVNASPEGLTKRLGDAYFDTQLIRNQVTAQTGRAFIDGAISSAAEQMRQLLDNGVAYANAMQLVPGVALSVAQQQALTQNIVWYEAREYQGQIVLVPQLYLADASLLFDGGASIHATNLAIHGSDITNDGGSITADDQLSLTAERAITQIGGRLEGGRIYLDAGSDIEFATRTHTTGNGVTHIGTLVEKRAQVKAREFLSLNAKNDIRLIGVDVNSDGDSRLQAGRDISVGAVALHQKTDVSSPDSVYKTRSVEHRGSTLNSAGNLTLGSERNIEISGSEITAGENLALNAEGDTLITSLKDEAYQYSFEKKKGSFGRAKTRINESNNDTIVASQLSGNTISINAQTNADGSISTTPGGDVTIVGSQLNAEQGIVLSGDAVNILAATYNRFSRSETHKKGFAGLSSKSQGEITRELQLSAAELKSSHGDINITAASDMVIAASNVLSQEGDVNLEAVDDVLISAGEMLKETQSWSQEAGFFKGGDFYSADEVRDTNVKILARSASVEAGNNLTINAGRAKVVGSDLTAGNNITATTDIGDIEILAASESETSTHYEKHLSVSFADVAKTLTKPHELIEEDDGQLKAKLAEATYDQMDSDADTVSHKDSRLSSGNDITLNSVQDILIEGSTLSADNDQSGAGDIKLIAEENVTIKEAEERFDEKAQEVHGKAEVSAVLQNQVVEVAKAAQALKEAGDQLKQSKEDYRKYQKDLNNLETTLANLEQEYEAKAPGVSYADVVELRDLVSDVGDDEEWYQAGIATSALNVASKYTALIQQTGALGASTVTWTFNAGIQLDVDTSKTTTENHQTGSLASNLSAANIAIQTGGGAYRDDGSFNTDNNTQTTIQGSHLQAQQGIAINTGDLNVLASKDTSQDKTDYEHGHLTIQQTVWGAVGGPVVSASYDKSQEKSRSTTYNNSTLSADNIDLAANNVTINGGNVDADERLRVDVGEKLHIESVQNRSSGSNKGFGVSGGFGFAGNPEVNKHTTASNSFNDIGDTSQGVSSANGGLNASSGRYTNRETLLSTLTSGNEADINVGGETRIVGALVATLDEQGNDRGKLNLKTDTLSYEDLSNARYNQNRSIGVSTSVGLKNEKGEDKSNPADPAQQKAGKDDEDDGNRLNTSTLQYSNESGYSKTKTLATLGEGNISVADEANSDDLARLNRDVTATEKELFSVDRQQGNIDVTLDHRLLSKDGRKDIKEDFTDTYELGEDIYRASEQLSDSDQLGLLSFWSALHNNTQATQLKNDLVRNPENAHIIDGLTSGDGDQYAQAMSALGQLAQDKFGLELTDINFYNSLATTSTALTDNILKDVYGAIVLDPNNSQYGNIFIDAEGTKNDQVNTLGHELIESYTLQTSGKNDNTQEALANAFGDQFEDRIDQATGSQLSSTSTVNFTTSLQGSNAVYTGKQQADQVGNTQVDHFKLGVHKDITRVVNDEELKNLFLSKKHQKEFRSGLLSGVVYPDKPEGLIGLDRVFDVITQEAEDDAPKESLTYRSHLGDLQYWHSMVYKEEDPVAFQEKIIDRVVTHVIESRNNLEKEPKKAGESLGKALHTVQDSYSQSHGERNEDMEIVRFQDYTSQDHKKHGHADVEKGNQVYIEAATASTKEIIKFTLRNDFDKADFEKFLKNEVFPLKSVDGGYVETKMGGSKDEYKK